MDFSYRDTETTPRQSPRQFQGVDEAAGPSISTASGSRLPPTEPSSMTYPVFFDTTPCPLTCRVIDISKNAPAANVQVALRCVRLCQLGFEGITNLVGEVQHWRIREHIPDSVASDPFFQSPFADLKYLEKMGPHWGIRYLLDSCASQNGTAAHPLGHSEWEMDFNLDSCFGPMLLGHRVGHVEFEIEKGWIGLVKVEVSPFGLSGVSINPGIIKKVNTKDY